MNPAERVIDVGCGTGNAALFAAEHVTHVVGVDPAMRLLDVARGRAAVLGLDVTFVSGDAAEIPLEDEAADVVISVFGVIFTHDVGAAADEMSRILAHDGRIVLSAWIPSGAMYEMNTPAGDTVRHVVGAPREPAPFAWHDAKALSSLFEPHGLVVTVEERSLVFTAPTARDFMHESRHHPFAVAAAEVMLQHGKEEAWLTDKLLAVVEAGNEDREAFRLTSPYVIATAQRPA